MFFSKIFEDFIYELLDNMSNELHKYP
jgi:hypothetical protein